MKIADAAVLFGLPATATEDEVLAAIRDRQVQAARPPGPWGSGDPVAWALTTGRVTASSADFWRARHRTDPADVEATLVQLYPVLGATIAAGAVPAHNEAADAYSALYATGTTAGPRSIAAAGYAGRQPTVDASPERPTGVVFRNPLEQLRSTHPAVVASAERGGPAPALFEAGGNLPTSTASGEDPALLAGLPWQAKLCAAYAPTSAEMFRVIQTYSGPEAQWQADGELMNDPHVRDAVGALYEWARTSGLDG